MTLTRSKPGIGLLPVNSSLKFSENLTVQKVKKHQMNATWNIGLVVHAFESVLENLPGGME
jgi:hypothetical protein